MSFSRYFGTIAAGASMRLSYSFAGPRPEEGGDVGAQYAMASPLQNGGSLQVNDQAKSRQNSKTIYFVRVTNIGALATDLNLEGGGVT